MNNNTSQPEESGVTNEKASAIASDGVTTMAGEGVATMASCRPGLTGEPRDAGEPRNAGEREQNEAPGYSGSPHNAGGQHATGEPQGAREPQDAGEPHDAGEPQDTGEPQDGGGPRDTRVPTNTRRIEKRWFWISLISLFNSFYTVSSTHIYFSWAAEIEEHNRLIMGCGFLVAATGIIIPALTFKLSGFFDDHRRFKSVFVITSCIGMTSMVLFAVVCNTIVPDIVWPAFIFQYIATVIPAFTAGCAIQHMIKTIRIKSVAAFSGLVLIITLFSAIIHTFFLNAMASWRATETSFVTVYIALLLVPVILLVTGKDLFAYTAPKSETYFPDPLYRKFLILAIVFMALDVFYNSAYYAGGDFERFSMEFVALLFFLPCLTAVATMLLLRMGKWRPAMLAITLFICFQQGLVLFFADNNILAVVYAIMDTFSMNGVILFLFIPLVFCAQRRKSATATNGLLSLFFVVSSIPEFVSEFAGQVYSGIIAPAATFTLSIAAIAYLFYLYGEHNGLRTEELMKIIGDLRKHMEEEKLASDEAMRNAGFTEEETKVALLLIDGGTQRDVARKFHLSAAEASRAITDIREKISGISDRDPSVTSVVKKYKLTGRETHMLLCLRDGMTNPQIAAELVISEATVKNHVHNLMKKLPVDGRQNIASWLETVSTGAE